MNKHIYSSISTLQQSESGRRFFIHVLSFFLILFSIACVTPSITQEKNTNQQSTITPAPTSGSENKPTLLPASTLTPYEVDNQISLATDQLLQGARYGYAGDLDFNEFAVGMYDTNYPDCGFPTLSDELDPGQDVLLRLEFASPVIPQQIRLYGNIQPSQITRIELLNSISGVGILLGDGNSEIQQNPSAGGACAYRYNLSIDAAVEIDTVLIEFDQITAVSQIAAVELLGSLANYWDAPVYWRVPLPATPVDIAMGQHGMVYVAVEPNQLFAYDVEGNQLREYAVPEQSEITAIASDPFGNLLIQDNGFYWFIMLSPEGDQLSTGVVADYYWADVNPINGNLYLMNNDEISIYTTDTADLIDQFIFDEMTEYSALTFSRQGDLLMLSDAQWEPNIVQLNSETFEEMDANPLRLCNQMELTARDLAIDVNGNQYVLFTVNCAQIAIHEYNVTGSLIKRFGSLDVEINEWAEGTFLDPQAIAVSPDGRFLLVADGYDEKSYLTAYLMDID